VSTVS